MVVLWLSLLWVVVVFSVCCFVEFAFVRRFWFGCFVVNCGLLVFAPGRFCCCGVIASWYGCDLLVVCWGGFAIVCG